MVKKHIAHEALYALGLKHSFNDAYGEKHYFKYKRTDSIMDYTHLDDKDVYSTWKWQWETARRCSNYLNKRIGTYEK